MHDKYISSEESYLEYLDRLDNEILLRSRDRKIKEANQKAEKEKKKAEEANQRAEKANNEIDSILQKINICHAFVSLPLFYNLLQFYHMVFRF